MTTAARKIGPDTYSIPSFNGAGDYTVSLEFNSCSCPHFQRRLAGTNRGDCKHLAEVKRQAPRIELLEKARGLSEPQLNALLEKYGPVSPEIGGALRIARQERRTAAVNEARLRHVFA